MKDNAVEPVPARRYDAVLIDLDGTLLSLDLGRFVPAYIEMLAQYFAHRFPTDQLAAHLLAATMHMIGCTDREKTNETVFFADFCRRVGMERALLDPLLDDFYRDEFSRLRQMSKPRPHAQAVLEAARRRCRKVVLATQPIFPRPAASERLSWGGLSAHYFDLITTLENMHGCKPHGEYYLEIAEKIGIPPERCLMAGNDTREDLVAAETGMGTFLVEGEIIDHGSDALPHDYRGTLADLAGLIEKSCGPAIR